MGYSQIDLDYEAAEGVHKMSLAVFLDRLIKDSLDRTMTANHALFPSLIWAIYTPRDFRYRRNIQKFRGEIQRMINERRSGKTQSYSQEDLLSIMINTDFFQGNDELIIDEVMTFFLAGMKTIQISTTNLIYYLTKH